MPMETGSWYQQCLLLRAGWNCECSAENLEGQPCRPDNSSSGPECSDRGECVCGKCECHTGGAYNITGQYCECDSRQCDRSVTGQGHTTLG